MTVLSTYLTLGHVLRSNKLRLLKNKDPRQNVGEHITLNSGSIGLGKTWQFNNNHNMFKQDDHFSYKNCSQYGSCIKINE